MYKEYVESMQEIESAENLKDSYFGEFVKLELPEKDVDTQLVLILVYVSALLVAAGS